MDFMFDWEAEGDRFSFEDSDRFEEDSLCSWISEPESLCNNWRGWRKNGGGGGQQGQSHAREGRVTSLVELAAQAVAQYIPFEVVEHFYPPIPEQLQLRIAFWSFPENEEDIRLYSCLANGSADEFHKGEHLYNNKSVKDVLQIGFHLSGTVTPAQAYAPSKGTFNVAVVFDRRRITSCTCTCNGTASWCAHVVALCLHRIIQATSVCLRAPVSESLSRLHRDQLQKFAQYLISELPQQILPTAQRLLDELLSSQQNAINTVCGAPDPTAGPSASEQTCWCLDEETLHENIKKTLIKFCVPSPIVFSDVNYLSSTAPPAASEWQSLLRPLRGREPEGMWNLLSIIRELFRRRDSNAIPLLEILTDEVLSCEQLLLWWFNTKISAAHNSSSGHNNRNSNNGTSSSQHAASSLCDEIVSLWRLAALNPALSPIQRDDLVVMLKDWHIIIIDKVRKAKNNSIPNGGNAVKKSDIEIFPGFKPSIEACQLDWSNYKIAGVTYVEKTWTPVCMGQDSEGRKHKSRNLSGGGDLGGTGLITRTSNKPVDSTRKLLTQVNSTDTQTDGGLSSSSEGFCENFKDYKADASSTAAGQRRDSDSSFVDEATGGDDKNKNSSETQPKVSSVVVSVGRGDTTTGLVATVASSDADTQASGAVGPAVAVVVANTSPKKNTSSGHGGAAADNSESQQSSDEYQVYYYDPKAKLGADSGDKKKKSDEPNYFAGIKRMENKQEILFARAEALHAHGHTREACRLAQQLAEEMLANPPDLTIEPLPSTGKSKKKKHQNNTSSFASTTLAKAAFLCNVLLEDPDCHHLAFKVGMFGLEMPRQPASSKALEVKLANQEAELTILLKKIPLGLAELNVIRERAEQLRDGKLRSRGEALLPLTLASFIFDSLCLPANPVTNSNSRPPSRSVQITARLTTDEKLGFEAAVAALGLKANVSEADHPLLCEGTRRQRGELAIAMLFHYKDDQPKLSKIMDKVLDPEIHQLYKAQAASLIRSYMMGARPSQVHQDNHHHGNSNNSHTTAATVSIETGIRKEHKIETAKTEAENQSNTTTDSRSKAAELSACQNTATPGSNWQTVTVTNGVQNLEYLNLEQKFTQLSTHATNGGARPKATSGIYNSNRDTDSSALEDDGEGSGDYKAWEAKFRCTNLKTFKKSSGGMASIDSSAPETTSSDNSPTLVRRNKSKHQGPGSDCSSSGKSSDSLGSSSSGDKGAASKIRDNESPIGPFVTGRMNVLDPRTPGMACLKGGRHKNKNRMPTIPNQPSEALAHFMFELAKTVLTKAGGNSSTSLFTQPSNNNAPSGPHRNLHLCAFQIGLYALGIHNCVSPNWLSRTYSSHVSWITGQAMEIGSAAVNILIDTWEGHLTPPEAANLADRASRGRDPNMVRVAAELALACLPNASSLNPNEIQRALIQCKEQSQQMLERACLAVESAAKDGGVYPEVLFDVARRWYELYEEAKQGHAVATQSDVRGGPVPAHVVEEMQAVVPVALDRNSPQSVLQMVPFQQIPTSSVGQSTQQAIVRGQHPQAATVTIPYTIPQAAPTHQIYPYAYSYVQVPAFGHHQPTQPTHIHQIPAQVHPAYVATTYSYPNQAQHHFTNIQNMHGSNASMYHHANHAAAGHIRPGMPTFVHTGHTVNNLQPPRVLAAQGQVQGVPSIEHVAIDHSQIESQHQQAAANSPQSVGQQYLLATYRVGMLAMETLARRVHDDRPLAKYARNPPYGEDVKWVLSITKKLGTSYLSQFCASAVNAVVSPFILYEITIDVAHFLARNNPTQVSNQLRSPILSPVVQKCLQMFVTCSHQRISHITQADYDDFVGIVCSARNAFCMTPGGMVQFNELLQSLRRSKFCKKDLWQRIVNGLATGNIS